MNDLKPEERDALIEALENEGELLVGTPIEPYWSLGLIQKRSFATQDDDGTPLLDSTWELNPAGTLLAQSLKREREARAWRPTTEPGSPGQISVFLDRFGGHTCGDWQHDGKAWVDGHGPQDTETLTRRWTHWLPLPPAPEPER